MIVGEKLSREDAKDGDSSMRSLGNSSHAKTRRREGEDSSMNVEEVSSVALE